MASVFPSRRADLATLASGFVLSCAIAGSGLAIAQTPAPSAQSAGSATKVSPSPAGKHPHGGASRKNKAVAAQPSPVVQRPPDPPPPDWPVNDKAKPASVTWNGRDLSVTAANSTLGQILHDVSVATGVKVDGLASIQGAQSSQRIYGNYGPASARDVLSQLLQGSGYNMIMVGDQGEGTPRELVLTAQASGGKGNGAPHANQPNQNSEEDAPEEPEPEPQPEPFRPQVNNEPVQPPQGPRTPQQMLQEIQQRQQQQQQQQQGQPQPQPPNN